MIHSLLHKRFQIDGESTFRRSLAFMPTRSLSSGPPLRVGHPESRRERDAERRACAIDKEVAQIPQQDGSAPFGDAWSASYGVRATDSSWPNRPSPCCRSPRRPVVNGWAMCWPILAIGSDWSIGEAIRAVRPPTYGRLCHFCCSTPIAASPPISRRPYLRRPVALHRADRRGGPVGGAGSGAAVPGLHDVAVQRQELSLRLRRFDAAELRPEPPLDAAALRRFAHLNLLGRSPRFVQVLTLIDRFAAAEAPVLIQGETGTGKELVARAIHYLGSRQARPFIPVNCGAIPDSLMESELFGHERGAFTDARHAHAGLVAQANGGTLFLDEIESLSPRGQVALLRFLQDQVYRPLGGTRCHRSDVRLIAAGNADLKARADLGRFRSDLYFRLRAGLDPAAAAQPRGRHRPDRPPPVRPLVSALRAGQAALSPRRHVMDAAPRVAGQCPRAGELRSSQLPPVRRRAHRRRRRRRG